MCCNNSFFTKATDEGILVVYSSETKDVIYTIITTEDFKCIINNKNIFKTSEFLTEHKQIICSNINNTELLKNLIAFVEYSNTGNKSMKLRKKDKLYEIFESLQQKIET